MVPRMISLTQRYGVRPERLKIEITERIIAEDTRRVLSVMNQLTRAGFGFYLDDFGTGYSSLSYVLTLPDVYKRQVWPPRPRLWSGAPTRRSGRPAS